MFGYGNSLCGVTLSVVRRKGHQQCSNTISVFIFVRHVFMSSVLIKPIVQHHRSRVSPVRDFPLHLWGNRTVKDPTQQSIYSFITAIRHRASLKFIGSCNCVPMVFTADRVHRHGNSSSQGSSERVLPWQITMDQLIFASLSHAQYWYEVGILKV